MWQRQCQEFDFRIDKIIFLCYYKGRVMNTIVVKMEAGKIKLQVDSRFILSVAN